MQGQAAPVQQVWSLDLPDPWTECGFFHFLAGGVKPTHPKLWHVALLVSWVKHKDTGSLFFILLYVTSLYQFLFHFFPMPLSLS